MPLKANLDKVEIQSFNLDENEWFSLKQTYKDQYLTMPCCQRRAVPKTSKLGTQYFAHLKRGDCTSSPETPEHIHLKYLVAKVAQQCGWKVTTEYAGSTPDGKEWITDVFCQKGDAKLAFEIQWSHQTDEEYERRTDKYTRSKVRCVWLSRQKGNTRQFSSNLLECYELPRFNFKYKDGSYLVTRYDTDVENFVTGVFKRKLSWLPKENQQLYARAYYKRERCWKCRKYTNNITSLDMYDKDQVFIKSFFFSEGSIAEWIVSNFSKEALIGNGIGVIKSRYSKTAEGSYTSNGCVHCDALQGNFFISYNFGRASTGKYLERQWQYNPTEISIDAGWFFEGTRGKTFY